MLSIEFENFLYSIEEINGKWLRFAGNKDIELWFNITSMEGNNWILTPDDIKKEKTNGWYVLSANVVGYIIKLKTRDNDIKDLDGIVSRIEKFFSRKVETIETVFSPEELE